MYKKRRPSSPGGPTKLDEPDAIDRATRGDAAAFEHLVRSHQDLAFRTAYLITGDAAEAEDAAQTGFVKAYYALCAGRFRPGAPFRPWLLQIVDNEARNRRSAAARRPALTLSALGDLPLVDPGPSPEAVAVAGDQRRHLIDALNQLREEDRAVLTYRYVLDLSEAEMAAALGCRRGTVKSRLSRSLVRLRAQLAAMDGSAGMTREDVR